MIPCKPEPPLGVEPSPALALRHRLTDGKSRFQVIVATTLWDVATSSFPLTSTPGPEGRPGG
jgi:hypothetical protein